MALPEGTRLGPYEIGGLLGAGGMGEVYRARDPRLGRNVAIKILPTELSRDAERLWRFEREARAVASLNHPHICTVYDIGEGFLVMELLEGQTLQERLKAGPLATPLLVDLALQIADALDAAHRAEIIHRDLKPENIFITTRSEAKLLDFGLAKLAGDAADNETIAELQLGQGPTFLHPRGETSIGTLLGTAAYMSPEQARGEPADAQSDLFSFGAVLYEMATGRPAFSGRTLAVLFDSILNKDPKPVAELNPAIPAELTHVIDKALEKERDLRYRTAADMRTDLKRLRRDAGPRPIVRDDGEAPAVSAATRPASGPPHVSDSAVLAGVVKRHRWGATALGVIALAAVIAVAYGFWSRGRAGGGAPVSLDSLQVTQLTSTGIASRPAISPDGKYIVYLQPEPAGGTSVWLRQTDATSGVRIMPPDNRGTPPRAATFGPDNAFVDVLRGGSIWRMPLLGGDAKLMLENALTPVAWAPDGQRLSVIRFTPGSPGSDLVVTDREGQNAQVVANRVAPNGFVTLGLPGTAAVAPAWAPDGRRIAAIQRFGEDVRDLGVVIFDVSSDTTEVVNIRGDAPQGLAWLDDRTLLIGQALETGTASQLWRVSVPDGHRSRLTNDVNRYSDLSVTADRNVLVTSRPEVRLSVWAGDAKGGSGREVVAPAPFLSSAVQYATVAWDGARLLFTHTLNGRFEIFRLDVDRAGATPEVVVAGREMSAAPDGTIVFRSVVDEGGLWKANRDGGDRVQLAKGSISYPFISANGRQVVFNGPTDTGQLLFVVPVSGGTPVPVVKDPISIAGFSDISPDGRLVAFARNDRWVVCELPSCSAEKTAGIPMGSRPRWMPDGKGLAYVEGRTGTNIWVQPLDASPPYALTHFTDGKTIGHYAFSSDGKRLAVSRETSTIDIVLFRGLRGQR